MNVHFDNFGYEELVSKTAKDKLKKQIKINLDKSKDIKMQLEEKTEEILEKYFKKQNDKDLILKFNVKDNDIHVQLEIRDKLLSQKEMNKKRLKDKLLQEKGKRYVARDRNKFIENEKKEKKLLNSDSRITPDMIQKYKIAKEKFGKELPNPIMILDDKSEHVKKYVEYVGIIIQRSTSEQQMMMMLDNEYSHYIKSVTGFDYKAIVNSFKQNLNKVKKEEEIKDGPIFEKLDEDSDDDKSNEINSDDEAILESNYIEGPVHLENNELDKSESKDIESKSIEEAI